MKRLVLGLTAGTIALALSSCSAVNPEALRVGGLSISQRDLDRELHAFVADRAARTRLEAVTNPSVAPFLVASSAGTVTSKSLTDVVLNIDIRNVATRTLLADAKVEGISKLDDDKAGEAIFGTAELLAVWKGLPAGLRARWAQGLADADALRTRLSGPTAEDSVRTVFFDAVKGSVGSLTFEQFAAATVQPLDDQTWAQFYDAAVTATANRVGVRVDPRYGTWDPERGLRPPSVAAADSPPVDSAPLGA